MAINALEKQIPKKRDNYSCPICSHYFEDGECFTYCPECGQRFEWWRMRLIDADRLLADLKEENVLPICIQNLTKKNKQIIRFENMIYEQPTAYDVDNVLKQLEDEKSHMSLLYDELEEVYKSAIDDAIEIVKSGGMNNNSKTSD